MDKKRKKNKYPRYFVFNIKDLNLKEEAVCSYRVIPFKGGNVINVNKNGSTWFSGYSERDLENAKWMKEVAGEEELVFCLG